MNHVDILQSLGLARSALDDFIASVSGPKIKDLLRERDQLTWAINRVCDERLRLAAMDTSDAITQLDKVTTDLDALEKKAQNIGKAIGLAEKLVEVIADLLPKATTLVTASVAMPSAADLSKAHALLLGAAAHLNAHASSVTTMAELDTAGEDEDEDEDEDRYNVFCDTHHDLPPARVFLDEAIRIEDTHKKVAANKNCIVSFIRIKQ
jgi:hypothetical protein